MAAIEGKHCLPERRDSLNQKPAVIDRRYKKAKVTRYLLSRCLYMRCGLEYVKVTANAYRLGPWGR